MPPPADPHPVVFYDGGCGLCHCAVMLLLRLDADACLRFAPLGGRTFEARVSAEDRAGLPDSLLLSLPEGRLLVRGSAVREGLRRLGPHGRLLAAALSLVPTTMADRLYDAIARRRHRFGRPEGWCPVTPSKWRGRFLP